MHRALDTISTELTHLFALNVFGPGPGKLTVIQPLPLGEKAQQLRPDVEKQSTHSILRALSRTNADMLPPKPSCSTLHSAANSSFPNTGPYRPRTKRTWPGSWSRPLSSLPPAK